MTIFLCGQKLHHRLSIRQSDLKPEWYSGTFPKPVRRKVEGREKAFALLAQGETTSIFQLEGVKMTVM